MKPEVYAVLVVCLMLSMVQVGAAVVVVDEVNDVLHYKHKIFFRVIDTEVRSFVDIVWVEYEVIHDILHVELVCDDSVYLTNTTSYSVDLFDRTGGNQYSFSWFMGWWDNSSNSVSHSVVDNVISCSFVWNSSQNFSELEMYAMASDSCGIREFWLDAVPDVYPSYLWLDFWPGFVSNSRFGRGFTVFGRNYHVSKSVNITFSIKYENWFESCGGINEFCVEPREFFGGHTMIDVMPLVAWVNATVRVENFSQSYVGLKVGQWVFVQDMVISYGPEVVGYDELVVQLPQFFPAIQHGVGVYRTIL